VILDTSRSAEFDPVSPPRALECRAQTVEERMTVTLRVSSVELRN
jgi:hypothetical protein